MGSHRYVVIDVFTDRPLTGNQLAVFTDARDLPEKRLQPLAREVNFSETVFVFPAEGEGHARIRIFTPRCELPFAGHPVLGAAFVLAAPLQLGRIVLETGRGMVPVDLERAGDRIVFGRMCQPLPAVAPCEFQAALLSALGGVEPVLPVEVYDNGPRHTLVGLADPEELAGLVPNLAALAGLPATCAVCFAPQGEGWKVRSFCPSAGVSEDPATGSAAGPLACHLVRHGVVETGKEIRISQGEETGRPSTLYARAEGERERIARVEVGGAAVVVARGEFRF